MIEYAAMAVHNGLADHVCCVFADSPLQENKRTGAAYSNRKARNPMSALMGLYGFAGANAMYALGAQRHMDLFGTTQEQMGQVAISQRQWAGMNERATKREPLSMDEYHASPWVVDRAGEDDEVPEFDAFGPTLDAGAAAPGFGNGEEAPNLFD